MAPTPALDDVAVALPREGYHLLPRLRAGRPAAPVRFLGRRALVVGGPDGVRLFYDAGRLRRRGGIPLPLKTTLFGRGAVHGLDGERHEVRKALFLDVTRPDAVDRLAREVAARFDEAVTGWTAAWTTGHDRDLVLFDEIVDILGAAVLAWAGVPAPADRIRPWSGDLATIVDGFGTPGAPFLAARRARRRSERWARAAVRATRQDRIRPPLGSALDVVARHRDADGRLLSEKVAAVELLNVVRPTVAVAWYVDFLALALHEHPQWRDRLARTDGSAEGEAVVRAVVHEVRRLYPFVPALGARARRAFDWNGEHVRQGALVLLDVHGTDHDPDTWPDPDSFSPGRFLEREPDAWSFVPQGGGDPATGHRCPGEGITIAILSALASRLAFLDVDLPEQDLSYDLARVPTRPRSGLVLQGVRLRALGTARP